MQRLRRRGAVVTAAMLARELEVSERTIYRDIADLIASGVPITGEAGVGHRLPRGGFDLPPLMFNEEEIQALVLGLFYWGLTWRAGSSCELRDDFRNFRLDRITKLEVTEERFTPTPGRTLQDLFEYYRRTSNP